MSDLIAFETVKPERVQRALTRMSNLSKKGAELAELISAWTWAVGSFQEASSNSITNRIDLDYQKTADEAERLRLMRTDLLHLLGALPDKEKPSDNGIVLNAKLSDEDEEGSSASGDWDIDLGQLLNDNENSRDVALMVRHGLLDDMIDTTRVEMGTNPVDSASSAVFLAPESDKDFSDAEKANPEA